MRRNQLYVSRATDMNIVDSRCSCDNLWLSSQERRANDDCYTVQTITQLFDKVNIGRKNDDPMMTVTLFKQ
jgi:hypothetical protein